MRRNVPPHSYAPMYRPLALLCILALPACAPSRVAATQRATATEDARADSLIALPADSLSERDAAWLAAHAARRQRRNTSVTGHAVLIFAALAGAAAIAMAVSLASKE